MPFFLVKEKDCVHPRYPTSTTPALNPGYTVVAVSVAFDSSGTTAASGAPDVGMQKAKVVLMHLLSS